MSPRLTYPGVYVQEKPSGVRTITGVATSTTLFVGMARSGPLEEPVAIRSVDQFEQIFGADTGYGEMVAQMRQYFLNGGGEAIVVRIASGASAASVTLRNSAGTEVLVLTARSAGVMGREIRAMVDYDTPTPEISFNIELFRRSIDANGATVISEAEFFGDLSMDPASPRYAPVLLSQNSALVTAALPDPAFTPDGEGFSQSGLILPADDTDALDRISTALAVGNRLSVAVSGGVAVPVALPMPGAGLAVWLEQVGDVISAALVAFGQPGGVEASLAPFGTGRALRLTATPVAPESVVVTAAAQADASRALHLGSAAGGVEISAHARFRPAPTGFTTALHSLEDDSFAAASDFARLISFATADRATLTGWTLADGEGGAPVSSVAAPAFPEGGTTFLEGPASDAPEGALRNTARHLDALAASLATQLGTLWNVRRFGLRLSLSPRFGSSNTGAGATLTTAGGLDLGAATGMAHAVRAANVGAYALGSSGAGAFQTPGAAGSDGNVPDLDAYRNAFSRVESEVDIFNLLVLPRGADQSDADRAELWGTASAFCARARAFLIVDPPRAWGNVDDAREGVADLRLGTVTDHAALYWPRLRVAGLAAPIDPGGTVAGIMARTDTRRGVWKAPAGLDASVLGARGLEHLVSDAENGVTNPQAINTLRQFSSGAVVWGARTMAGFDNSGENDYRYVPVRRTALFIQESLYRGLQFAVFEPNDEPLWAQIRLAAGAFMQNLFRQGAFQGAKASDAYLVRCDASTTTQNDINLGRVNVVVGFAPLRPAEFVVLTVRQLAGQVQT